MRIFSFRKPRKFHHVNIYQKPYAKDEAQSEFSHLKGKFGSQKIRKRRNNTGNGALSRIILIAILIIAAILILKLPLTLL